MRGCELTDVDLGKVIWSDADLWDDSRWDS